MVDSRLWYGQPAAGWNEALPIGNGVLGAMLHGGLDGHPAGELLELNEGTLWSGFPRDDVNYEARRALGEVRSLLAQDRWFEAQATVERRMLGRSVEAYQPLGSLKIRADAERSSGLPYRRELDLSTALHTVQAGPLRCESFASHPDRVIACRWALAEGTLPDLQLTLTTPHPSQLSWQDGALHLHGQLPSRVVDNFRHDHPEPVLYEPGRGLEFSALLQLLPEGGVLTWEQASGTLRLCGARAFTLLFTAASNHRGWDQRPLSGDPAPLQRCHDRLRQARGLGWAALKARHVADHRQLFGRVRLDLGGHQRGADPTDVRLDAYRNGSPDRDLERLYFDYGRYLLIACSRPGGEAATLQGLWNPHVQPPWQSDYTININTQMNYWPAEPCGLGECSEPLERLLTELAGSGRRTARIHYGAGGWTAHHNTDLWRSTTPTDGQASWAFWPLGGAWLARQLWERHLYRPDPQWLREQAWPVLAGAARFLLDWLVEQPGGTLGTSPSTSPENRFLDDQGRACAVSRSSTMDLSIVRDVLDMVQAAAAELKLEAALQTEIATALSRLPPFQVGSLGQLLEWCQEFPEAEPGHRHVSHLYGVYPAHLFGGQPALSAAAGRSLDLRLQHGGGHTGWSAAWIINLHARLQDAPGAAQMLRQLLAHSTLPNLFDTHPPFQIDGNFGGAAGIAELLLQSHGGELHLLPALPAHWPDGSVEGMRARGGLRVDLLWRHGQLVRARVQAQQPHRVQVRCGHGTAALDLAPGRPAELTPSFFIPLKEQA